MRDAETVEFGGSSRRAVGGFAEVCDQDVHVGDSQLSLSAKFGSNPASRLGIGGVFVILKTGGSKFTNSVLYILVENREGSLDRNENAGAVA